MRKQRLSLNLDPGIVDGLRRRAVANRRSISAELSVLIEPHIDSAPKPAQTQGFDYSYAAQGGLV